MKTGLLCLRTLSPDTRGEESSSYYTTRRVCIQTQEICCHLSCKGKERGKVKEGNKTFLPCSDRSRQYILAPVREEKERKNRDKKKGTKFY